VIDAREAMAAWERLARLATGGGEAVLPVTDACFVRPKEIKTPTRMVLAAVALVEADLDRARRLARDIGANVRDEGVGQYAEIWEGRDPVAGYEIRKEAPYLRGLRALADGDDARAKAEFERYLAAADRGDFRLAARTFVGR
jgi:hypothetical protein